MAKPPPAQKPVLDIFNDDDLNNAQIALAAAIEPQDESGEAREKGGATTGKEVVEIADPHEQGERDQVGAAASDVEATNAHLKFRVRQTTRAGFDSFRAELSAALGGARLMDSNVGRALLDWFLFEAGERVLDAVREDAAVLKRPASDDAPAMAAFPDRTTCA